jgi:hypothetical protein
MDKILHLVSTMTSNAMKSRLLHWIAAAALVAALSVSSVSAQKKIRPRRHGR